MKKLHVCIICLGVLVLGFFGGWFAHEFRPKYDSEWNRLKGEGRRLAKEPGYSQHRKAIDALLEIRHDAMRCKIKERPQEQSYLSTLVLFMATDAGNLELTGPER